MADYERGGGGKERKKDKSKQMRISKFSCKTLSGIANERKRERKEKEIRQKKERNKQ